MWDLIYKTWKTKFDAHSVCVSSLCFSNKGEYFVSGGVDAVKVSIIENFELVYRFDGHDLRILQIFVSQDDTIIVSFSLDFSFRVWENGKRCVENAHFMELNEKVTGFSSSMKYLIAISENYYKTYKVK